MTTQARADIAAMQKSMSYRSPAESAFAQVAEALLWEKFGQLVERMDYEPVTWKMPGNSYTPDFMAILSDGRVVFIEVKGSRRQRGYRDARSKLRQAAALHPEFVWCEAMVTLGKGGAIRSIEFEVIS